MSADRHRRPSKAKPDRQKPSRGITALEPSRAKPGGAPLKASKKPVNQVIPEVVANRMARRIAIASGVPTLLGMGVFVASYLLVSRKILAISPATTLLASGGCFLLGLLGLSYGVLSASWEEIPGSLLGSEQIPLNLSRIKGSLRALRQGPQLPGD